MAFAFSLALDPTFGILSHKTLGTVAVTSRACFYKVLTSFFLLKLANYLGWAFLLVRKRKREFIVSDFRWFTVFWP